RSQREGGAPPLWRGYSGLDAVASPLAASEKTGGRVLMPKMSIPNGGDSAITADRQGAAFSPFRYTGKDAGAPETNDRPGPFTFCWDELLTADPDDAAKFYGEVFGWGAEKLSMADFGGYIPLQPTRVEGDDGAGTNTR